MSRFSGKCDLFDHMSGLGGWFDKDGNPAKVDEGSGALYSDEMLDFIEFKRRTGGVIHQYKQAKVSYWNQKDIEKYNPFFKVEYKTRTVNDKRYKNGTRTESYCVYHYFDKEYTSLKELNKRGVLLHLDIHFDTILDLIPYYPYIVIACASDKDSEYVTIARAPNPVDERDVSLETGGSISEYWESYAQTLQNHYKDIVLRYFNPEGRECLDDVEFDDDGIGVLANPIVTNFKLEFRDESGDIPIHFKDPEVVDADEGVIKISKEDLLYIGNRINISYVKQKERELHLA